MAVKRWVLDGSLNHKHQRVRGREKMREHALCMVTVKRKESKMCKSNCLLLASMCEVSKSCRALNSIRSEKDRNPLAGTR